MLSSKVDLTEHNDFGERQIDFNHIHFERIDDWIDAPLMSKGDADRLLSWENIFGRKRHYTEALDVFRDDDDTYYERKLKNMCARCGKYVTMPWKLVYHLCPECQEHEERIYGDGHILQTRNKPRIPWSLVEVNNFASNRFDDARDIFNIR